MPSLGSSARNDLIDSDHRGSASRALVNMPVPDPILQDVIPQAKGRIVADYSTISHGPGFLTAARI